MGHSYRRVACNGRLLMVDGGLSFTVRGTSSCRRFGRYRCRTNPAYVRYAPTTTGMTV